LVWGCAYDPDARRAHAAVANLGLLLTIDYDRGTLLSADFVEVGLRPMTVDAVRRRLYVANFIRGDLHALDLDTGEQVRTWFVGRFVRGVRLSRDGRALWVTSNLGVVRVWLASMDDP
jgi:DNA-binding beta-propeller fold protein YncE